MESKQELLTHLDLAFAELSKAYPNDISALKNKLSELGISTSQNQIAYTADYLVSNDLAIEVNSTIGGDIGLKCTLKGRNTYQKSLVSANGSLSSLVSLELRKTQRKRLVNDIIKYTTVIMALIGGLHAIFEMVC